MGAKRRCAIRGSLGPEDATVEGRTVDRLAIDLVANVPHVMELSTEQFAPLLTLANREGTQAIARDSGVLENGAGVARFHVTPTAGGNYAVVISSDGSGPYRLSVARFAAAGEDGEAQVTPQ